MQLVKKSLWFLLLLQSYMANAAVVPVYQIDDTQATYLQTTLTHDIYRYSNNDQLNDLIVIDSLGNKLPYHISTPDVRHSEKVQLFPVRFFPVAVGAAPETLLALSSASIRLDANEISVSVEKTDNKQLQDQSIPVDFYVVDLSDLRQPVGTLKVNWLANDSSRYLEVQVSGTNDLTNWTDLTKTTLVQLQKDGESLTRNKIALDLSQWQYAYLRLKFLRGGDQLKLTEVVVENTDKIADSPAVDRWELQGELADEQQSVLRAGVTSPDMPVAAWEFHREDIAPVSKIGLLLGTKTYGDQVRIYSRKTNKQPWNLVHQGIWFNTEVGAKWQQSDDVRILANSDSYWRVELNQAVRTSVTPVLVFNRRTDVLQFIANSSPPFKIAIETDNNLHNPQTSAQIFSQLVAGKNMQWNSATVSPLNPDIGQFARHGMLVSWKTILFWGVLIAAVGILLFVAIRLLKQVSKSTDTGSNVPD